MNEDHIDSLVQDVMHFIERELETNLYDDNYDKLKELIYRHLDKWCTTERNYN